MNKLLILGFVALFACAVAVDCPSEDENSEATYYPHELECGKFYECKNGAAQILECAPGTYWNSRINVCDWDVDCGELLTSTAPPSTTSTTPETTTEATAESTKSSDDE